MKTKKNYTFCIFKNEIKKIFHIWKTTQKFNKKTNTVINVSIVNAESKSNYALSKKDSAQPAATTTFYRILPSTNIKDWAVEFQPLGYVNKSELQIYFDVLIKELEDKGFEFVSNKNVCFRSGKYAGRKYKTMLIEDMKKEQIENHSSNMLKNCLNPNLDIDNLKTKVYKWATDRNSPINNISQLWEYVFENYSESGSMYKRAA